jgi:hypothetical protein
MLHTPWIGLLALVAMFALPYLPNWLLEGPRAIKHLRRRHVRADCGAPWTDSHVGTAARNCGGTSFAGRIVERRRERCSQAQVVVRDSKERCGPVLVFTAHEWAAFLRGVRASEFDQRAELRSGQTAARNKRVLVEREAFVTFRRVRSTPPAGAITWLGAVARDEWVLRQDPEPATYGLEVRQRPSGW